MTTSPCDSSPVQELPVSQETPLMQQREEYEDYDLEDEIDVTTPLGTHEDAVKTVDVTVVATAPVPRRDPNVDQADALVKMRTFVKESYDQDFLLHGPAGSGKTFTLQFLVQEQVKQGRRVVFTAPTNKALKVLRKAAKRMGLGSVHFMTTYKMLALELKPDGEGGEKIVQSYTKQPCVEDYDLVIVDEGSMVKRMLKTYLDQELSMNLRTKTIYMADKYQLPPVNEDIARVFTEIENSYELTKIERQRDGSPLAHLIESVRSQVFSTLPMRMPDRANHFTPDREEGVWWLDRDEWLNAAIRKFKSSEYREDVDNIRVLAWRRKSVANINARIRHALFGDDADEYIVGERVITKGPVTEGESILLPTSEELEIRSLKLGEMMGYKIWVMAVESLDEPDKFHTLKVLHRDDHDKLQNDLKNMATEAKFRAKEGAAGAWNDYYELKKAFAPVGYSHALTTHNSQGSTFRTAMVYYNDIMCNPRQRERNQCLYTAFSRASHRLVICR